MEEEWPVFLPPIRGGCLWGTGNQWFRCAPPPASFFQPSGLRKPRMITGGLLNAKDRRDIERMFRQAQPFFAAVDYERPDGKTK